MRTIHLPVAEPCHERWDTMDPEAQGRFCQRCSKSVHDVSSMSEDEAHAFLRERAGTKICVRYAHDAAGNVRFRRPAALAIAAVALAACTPHDAGNGTAPLSGAPGKRIDLDHLLDLDLFEHEEQTVGELIAEPMPEPPKPIEPPKPVEVEPPPPDVTHMKMGMVAVQHEPCDPPTTPGGATSELPRWHEGMR